MMIKIYWATRIMGYLACLSGIFLYLTRQADPDPRLAQTGLALVGVGFLAFFVSYAIRAWLRFGPHRSTRAP